MRQNKETITPKMRGEYINNCCVVMNCPNPPIEGKDWIEILSKDTECYLTAGTSLEEIEGKPSILDMLIREGIDHVETSFTGSHVANIGFSERQNKWFGWSHLVYYGFTIGSKVKKGHCAYIAANKADFEEDMLRYWCGEGEGIVNGHIEDRTDNGFDIVGTYSTDPKEIPNERLRGKKYIHHEDYPRTFGRGEWQAETMDDAKQMAIDFALEVA